MSRWFPRRRLSALGRRRLLRLINALSLSARFHATCTYERCIRIPIDARKAFPISLTAGQVLHFSGRRSNCPSTSFTAVRRYSFDHLSMVARVIRQQVRGWIKVFYIRRELTGRSSAIADIQLSATV
jgi:hypothetical protein